jgi:hypothetical protein
LLIAMSAVGGFGANDFLEQVAGREPSTRGAGDQIIKS